MNDFRLNPRDLFKGSIEWTGIRNERFRAIDAVNRRREITTEWPKLLDLSVLPTEWFKDRGRSQLANRDSGMVETIEFNVAGMGLTLIHGVPSDLWLPEQARAEAHIEHVNDTTEWAAIGVAAKVAVGAFISQPWVPSMVPYRTGGEPGVGKVHIAPLSGDSLMKLRL